MMGWRELPSTVARVLHALPMMIIAAVAAGYGARLLMPPTLWFDEAMLLSNVRDMAWSALLQPPPYYDQTAPLGYIALLKVIYGLFGLNEGLLRLPSWLALAGSLALIFRLPDLDRTARLVACAVLAGSFVVARVATDAKPYMFDVFFGLALIMAFHPATTGLLARTSSRLLLVAAAIVMTVSFPLVVFAVAAPAILTTLRTDLISRSTLRQSATVPLAVVFGIALALFAAYFALYIGASLKLVSANHAYDIQTGFYNGRGGYLPWVLGRSGAVLYSHMRELVFLIAALALAGFGLLTARLSVYAGQMAALAFVMVILNKAGLFPILNDRFSIFLLPWLAIAVGATGSWVAGRLPHAMPRSLCCGLMVSILIYPGAGTLTDPFHQQARASLAKIRKSPDIPLVPIVSAQPIADIYVARKPDVAGKCLIGGLLARTTRRTEARAPGAGPFLGDATKWFLMNYVVVESWDKAPPGLPAATVQKLAADYYDWFAAEVLRHPRAHVLLLQANSHIADAVTSRLSLHGKLTRVLDERGRGLSHGAAQLYLFERSPKR